MGFDDCEQTLTFLQRILRWQEDIPTHNKPLDLHGLWRRGSGLAAINIPVSFS